MDASVFYYTYSTIAQKLASAFGFFVAVVLYRIDRISTNISIYEDRRGRVMKTLEHVANNPNSPYLAQYNSIVQDQQVEGDKITRLKADLRRSLLWTAFTIMPSVIMIALTPFTIWLNQYLSWVIVFVVVSAAIYTIWTYTLLAIEVTK